MQENIVSKHTIYINEKEITYQSFGTGPKLLLLHGFGISSCIWSDLIPHLEHSFNVITLDVLGYGNNKKYDSHVDLKTQSTFLKEFIKNVGNIEYALGYSYGGCILFTAANSLDPTIKKLFFLETPFFRTSFIKALNVFFKLSSSNTALAKYIRVFATLSPIKQLILLIAGLEDIRDTKVISKAQKIFMAEINVRAVFKGIADIFIPFKEYEKIETSIPFHFIYGEKDGFARTHIPEKLVNTFPNAKLDIVKDAYHLLPLEEPEELARIIIKNTN